MCLVMIETSDEDYLGIYLPTVCRMRHEGAKISTVFLGT